MIRTITIVNENNESVVLELERPEKSGLLVFNVSGLGPVKATINSNEMFSTDGIKVNSTRLTSRNITMELVLLEKPDIETTRHMLYSYFPIKKPITIVIATDIRTVMTSGYVETNEVRIFTKLQTTSLSIICPDPYFYSLDEDLTIFSGIEPYFEFPFESTPLGISSIIMGEIQTKSENIVPYFGDAATGIVITITASGPVTNLTIYNKISRETFSIDTNKLEALTGFGIIASDTIIISTIKGAKSIFLLREGVYINIINAINLNSSWFQITKNTNIFAYTAETGATYVSFRISNKTLYEGI